MLGTEGYHQGRGGAATFGELGILVYRTAILYVVALMVFRLMGKRTLAKMGPFDFAVIIMIGEAVAIGMEDVKTPLLNAIGITVALGVLQYILTWLNVRFKWLERLTQGVPTKLISNGRVDEPKLVRERISDTDLVMELRQKNITALEDVEAAYLEPTGEISIKKAQASGTGSSGGNTTSSSTQTSPAPQSKGTKDSKQ